MEDEEIIVVDMKPKKKIATYTMGMPHNPCRVCPRCIENATRVGVDFYMCINCGHEWRVVYGAKLE